MRSGWVCGRAGEDVHVVLRQHVGDVAEQLRTVERLDLDPDDVVARRVVVPVDLDHAVGLALQAHRVRAVGAVDRDAAAAGDEAHDLVAGHRRAAPREAHHHVVEALDVHAGGDGRSCARTRRPLHGDRELLLAAAQLALHPLHDRLGRDVALAERGVQRLEVGVVEALGDRHEHRGVGELLHRQPFAAQRLDELVLAGVDRVDAALTREPLPDLRTGARRLHELQPVAARARALRPCS